MFHFDAPALQLGIVQFHFVDVLQRLVVSVNGHQLRPVIYGEHTDCSDEHESLFFDGRIVELRLSQLSETRRVLDAINCLTAIDNGRS